MASILIVEDDHDLARTVSELLALDGHEAVIASSSETAAAEAKTLNPDLILLDITMPRVDGFEVARRLKADKLTQSIPIVVMTARLSAEACAAQIGTPHYLPKPFDIDTMLSTVEHIASTIG